MALEWIADIQILSGDVTPAKATYKLLINSAFNRGAIRRLEVKLHGVEQPSLAKALVGFLSFSRDRNKASHRVESLYRAFSTDPVVQYLRARHLFGRKQYLSAFTLLSKLNERPLPQSIKVEVHRLMAVMSFRSHCYQAARDRYEVIIGKYRPILTAGEIGSFQSWARRAEFFSKSERIKRFSCPLEIDNQSKPHHDVLHQE